MADASGDRPGEPSAVRTACCVLLGSCAVPECGWRFGILVEIF